MSTIACFGEVLWDVFPNHKKIGGAPLNVALRLHSFGNNTKIISRIGNDENGDELLKYISEKNLDISTIQKDKNSDTGVVNVTLDKSGSASYEIAYPVAWDKIELTDDVIQIVKLSDAFIFGSLACRDEVSRSTLLSLLHYASFKVFDINLRPPFYAIDLLVEIMDKADFIKLNDEELYEICEALEFNSKSMNEQIHFLSRKTNTDQICVTRGKDGAILFVRNEFYENPGYPVKVADTVGAGDSFLATLVNNFLLKKIDHDKALSLATAVGALVASKEGANPKIDHFEIMSFMNRPKG